VAASVPDSSDSRNHLRKHPPPDTLIAVDGVFLGFATIVLVILVGFALGHFGVLDMAGQRVLAEVAFQVGSPALMITVLSTADVHELFSRNLLATLAGVLVPATAFLVISRWWWQLPLSERVIGALASSYVNAGNLGLPIAAYVLGDAALVAPTLLLQLLIMQPLALTVLDHDRRGGAFRWGSILRRPLTNPLTLGALAGVALSATDTTLPPLLRDPIELIGGLAVPAMLLGYGVALRLGPPFGGGAPAQVAVTSVLKLAVQPAIAYACARWALGMDGHALLAVTVTSALPTAQNIFTHATRYGRAEALARDTILVTTLGCLPVIALAALTLG